VKLPGGGMMGGVGGVPGGVGTQVARQLGGSPDPPFPLTV